MIGGLGNDRELVIRDYLGAARQLNSVDQDLHNMQELSSTELLDLAAGAKALGFAIVGDSLDSSVSPRGYRLLSKVPRLPGAIVDRLVEHFDNLQKLLAANIEDLMAVEGVGEGRARAVREGLSRLAESSILERYV
jgi:diadenylate cyclase